MQRTERLSHRRDSAGAAPEISAVRRLVARRTARLRLQWADREEIVSAVLERLSAARTRYAAEPAASLGAIVAQNVEWAIVDFCRSAARRGERERLTAPECLPEAAAEPVVTRAERAGALDALLGPLTEREREILFERYVLELSAGEVGARHGMRQGAVKMACTRAVGKVRRAEPSEDAAFRRPRRS